MSSVLPMEVEQYIVTGNPADTIRAVTAAIERNEFGFDVLKAIITAFEKGREPRFAKTKPIPSRILEYIRQSDLPPMQAVYVGVRDGLWSYEDAETFVLNNEALSKARVKPEQRAVYLTRKRRTHRIPVNTTDRFVPKQSLEVTLSDQICDGAKACLSLLLSLAGKESVVVTYTSSLATQMRRTTRTIRNYFIQLEEAGLITRSAGKHQNTVKIVINGDCKPEPYKEPLDVTAFKLARRSANPVIRQMADAVTLMFWDAQKDDLCPPGRRKDISPFNPDSISYASTSKGVHAGSRRSEPPTTHSDLHQDLSLPSWRHGGSQRTVSFLGNATRSYEGKTEVPLKPSYRSETDFDSLSSGELRGSQ